MTIILLIVIARTVCFSVCAQWSLCVASRRLSDDQQHNKPDKQRHASQPDAGPPPPHLLGQQQRERGESPAKVDAQRIDAIGATSVIINNKRFMIIIIIILMSKSKCGLDIVRRLHITYDELYL
jgi:hypothetical protein